MQSNMNLLKIDFSDSKKIINNIYAEPLKSYNPQKLTKVGLYYGDKYSYTVSRDFKCLEIRMAFAFFQTK